MTENTPDPSGTAIPYFWVMTLQYVTRHGEVVSATADGMLDLRPGFTREKAFRQCRDTACRMIAGRTPAHQGSPNVVLFFSLEPDDIVPATALAQQR